MASVKPALTVVGGNAAAVGKSPLEAAYEHFRLDRMGNRASPNTLTHYDYMIRPFLAWAADEGVRRFEDLKVERLRHYRALVASRDSTYGRPLEGRSVLDSHKALTTFFRWAADEEYEVDRRILSLKRPKVAEKEATVWADLAELPHLLIGGMTGRGKSVFLRQLLVSLIEAHRADRLRLVLFDFKSGIEMRLFGLLGHLGAGGLDPGGCRAGRRQAQRGAGPAAGGAGVRGRREHPAVEREAARSALAAVGGCGGRDGRAVGR